MRGFHRFYPSLDRPGTVSQSLSRKDQRKWARLKLAIPVFVRASSGDGKDSLEFATAINISPGGALVIARRSLTKSARVSLEIPSAPIALVPGMPRSSRTMQAKAVWIKHLDDYHLLGLKFARPIGTDAIAAPRMRLRKASSAV
jgi:PilZ domain